MDKTEIVKLLNDYADMMAAIALVDMQKQDIIATILTPEIKIKLAEIDAEFADKALEATNKAETLKAEIKNAVIAGQESVKGDYFHAIYGSGRTSWDEKKLLKMAQTHPEIITARSQGDQSVTLRKT